MGIEAEREGEEQRRPLLSSSSSPAAEHQQQYQHLGRSSSSALRGGGGGWGGGGPEVSAAEVKSAASFSSSNYYPTAPDPHHDVVYPPSIHSAVLSPSPSPAPTPPHAHGLAIVPQGPYPYGGDYQPSQGVRRDALDEVEIRHLLIEHVGHRCCWGSRPARTWKITSIEDCNVYVGTLETFIEERDTIIKKKPYDGGKIDGRDQGPVLGVWELDLRSEFPLLFVPEKEVMVKIPHSEVPEKCLDCEGRGETPCPTCNAGQQHGFYKANQMTRCSACHGRGLLAHQDGSDTVCGMCNGQGMLPCIACGSRGLVTCRTCEGCGSLLAQSTAHVRWDVLDEMEIRNLLIDHVGHRCCWGSRPARTWKITSITDCIVYVGTLETFIEERVPIIKKEPYYGRIIDGRDQGPVLGVWELDLRSEFPLLFVEKEVMVKIPHSEVTGKCSDCMGRRETPCPTCNAGQQHGIYKANQMTQCTACDGRGLLACQDGSDESDTVCWMCNGQGMLPCIACGSRGLVTCRTCDGCGSLLAQSIARVRWKTLSARKVSAATGAASVPEEVFHRAQGVQLCNIQAYQCAPAFFADSYPLNQFSSEVVASRLPVPPSARVISERHIISAVPVTRVTMSHHKRSFSFYLVGYSRDIFVRDYPSKFCWGLCCCFEWLGY